MNLLEILEVDRNRLPAKSVAATRYIEGRWVEKEKPQTREALTEFLDGVISFCAKAGFFYPKILLKRLKQLQRGQWLPRAEA